MTETSSHAGLSIYLNSRQVPITGPATFPREALSHNLDSADIHHSEQVLSNESEQVSAPSKRWCGRRDLNPHGPFKPCGFSYRLRLSPPGGEALGGFTPGLRSRLSLHCPPENPKFRCCPSSLYTFPAGISQGLARDCHLRVPQASTKVFLKSAAYAIPPCPRAAA
jgi:hypothetical protein